jgi:hypothetical protein
MVLVVVTSWFPPGKSAEAGKKYLEVMKKYPTESFEKPVLLIGARPTKDGMKTISITEARKGNLEKVLDMEMKRMLMFGSVEGFKYEIETYLSGAEAMPMVGLGMPE